MTHTTKPFIVDHGYVGRLETGSANILGPELICGPGLKTIALECEAPLLCVGDRRTLTFSDEEPAAGVKAFKIWVKAFRPGRFTFGYSMWSSNFFPYPPMEAELAQLGAGHDASLFYVTLNCA